MPDRHSFAPPAELIADEQQRARREAENGVRQFRLALEIVRSHVQDAERPFSLRASHILQLHHSALDGIHLMAGAFRNTPVEIGGSQHKPPDSWLVADEVQHLCDYVNGNWEKSRAVHLAAYCLWRMNWIHPFADGNGRTARAISYVVLSIRMNGLLPGAPTIPEQIAADKTPYYDALEAADSNWGERGSVDVSVLEQMIAEMLARQLLSATEHATRPDH